MKFYWFFLLFPFLGYSQQPSHYKLGEEELEGVDIYGIHHGSDLNYYLATSQGLMIYDGYDFRSLVSSEMLMASVFNVVEDYNGDIYCHNLSGQVFKLTEDRLALFYTLEEPLNSADLSIEIDNQNHLVICAVKILFVDKTGRLVSETEIGYTSFPTRLSDGTIRLFAKGANMFYDFKDGRTRSEHTVLLKDSSRVLNTTEFQGAELLYESVNGNIYQQSDSTLSEIINMEELTSKKQSYRVYSTSKSLWLAPNSSGLFQFDEELNQINTSTYFSNEVISFVHEDREGNLVLGTFGNGLIVIPNERTRDVQLPFNEDVSAITRSSNGVIYLGTRSGKIYKADSEKVSMVRDDEGKRVETLKLFSNGQLLIDDEFGVLLDVESEEEIKLNVGSVKDAVEVDENTLLVASNMGCFWVDRKTGKEKILDELAMRYYGVGYDAITGSVYSSTAQGFFITDSSGTVSELTLDNESLIALDFEPFNEKMAVATREHGLIVFQKDTIVKVFDIDNGLISNNIRSIKSGDDKVILATDRGIQVLDLNLNSSQIIRASDGLATELILDVELVGDQLWVLHRKGAQTIDLNYLNNQAFEPELELSEILVNDSSVAFGSTGRFSSDERNFIFELNVDNLRYQKGIVYEYKLEGADESWKTKPFQNHLIQYQSLSAGSYTFKAKAVYRDSESNEVSYSFSIAAPFYLTWWFYALISLGLIALLAIWFYRRLKSQEIAARQQNELNASKLTAIQSQMNPHFIFNALNSIQDLVLKGDVANSYTYITKFADLVRRTLRYSDKNFVEFDGELKLIELYLTLEKLRFKEDFNYEINADGIDDILVPPMLIQPFIENALVHGLLHKSGNKRLVLDFELKDSLVCCITDNGVGRAKAKEIKERQRGSHESFSVNAIKKRFEILQRNFGDELGFTIDDLTEHGKPNGTWVRLSIPIKRKF